MAFSRLITNEIDLGLRYELWPALEESSRKTMLVLHGRGDSMEGFHWLPEALRIDAMNYLFLNAPDPYATGYSWYDLPPNQGPGVVRSRTALTHALDVLQSQVGLRPADLFLFGFSQGCLMSMDVGLRYPALLGGIVGVSGYVHFLEEYPAAFSPCALRQKFLVTHGTDDDMVPMDRMKPSVERLRKLGVKIDWREYAKDHSVDPARELPEIRERLNVWLESA